MAGITGGGSGNPGLLKSVRSSMGTRNTFMHIRLILLVAAVIAGIGAAVLRRKRKKIENKQCARCGALARHGYSKAAESALEDIVPLCIPCLQKHLDEDYSTYDGRAVIIQPVAELPCYVFRPKSVWDEHLRAELDTLLAGLENHCSSCTNPARYMLDRDHLREYSHCGANFPGPLAFCSRSTSTAPTR